MKTTTAETTISRLGSLYAALVDGDTSTDHLDVHDIKVIGDAFRLLELQSKKISDLIEYRNPEIWEILENDCSMENLSKALRHGRAMEARVVVLEKGLVSQNACTGLIPDALHALRDKTGIRGT